MQFVGRHKKWFPGPAYLFVHMSTHVCVLWVTIGVSWRCPVVPPYGVVCTCIHIYIYIYVFVHIGSHRQLCVQTFCCYLKVLSASSVRCLFPPHPPQKQNNTINPERRVLWGLLSRLSGTLKTRDSCRFSQR